MLLYFFSYNVVLGQLNVPHAGRTAPIHTHKMETESCPILNRVLPHLSCSVQILFNPLCFREVKSFVRGNLPGKSPGRVPTVFLCHSYWFILCPPDWIPWFFTSLVDVRLYPGWRTYVTRVTEWHAHTISVTH